MAHRNYFRQNNLWILKLATYTKIEDHYFRCKLATFSIGKDCHMFIFILSTQNIKFYWSVIKIKKLLLPIWWYNRGLFPLGNKYFGVFVLNGLIMIHFIDVPKMILSEVWGFHFLRTYAFEGVSLKMKFYCNFSDLYKRDSSNSLNMDSALLALK